MKTPIEPSQIRKGDLIRKEYEVGNGELALEYRATGDAHGKGGPGQHFPLDRPKPAVELPTEPTLGWLTYSGSQTFGRFRAGDISESDYATSKDAPVAVGVSERGKKVNVMFGATSFIPATAVPTEALDDLREVLRLADDDFTDVEADDLRAFLAAVDKAGEST